MSEFYEPEGYLTQSLLSEADVHRLIDNNMALRAEVARLQAAFTEIGFTNAELRAEVASLRETCGHLSERIEHWQTNAGINATSLAQVDAEVSRLTRINAELVENYWLAVDAIGEVRHLDDDLPLVHEVHISVLHALTTQQGTNDDEKG